MEEGAVDRIIWFLISILKFNSDATIYVGGLDEKVTDAILWELFVQAGPVVSVNMPKDRVTSSHQGCVSVVCFAVIGFGLLLRKGFHFCFFFMFSDFRTFEKIFICFAVFRFGFVEFMGEEDADYAIKIMNMIKLYGKPIKVS